MKIRKTNSHYSTIYMILSKASTLLRVSSRSTIRHRRNKTRMLSSPSLRSTTSMLNLKELPRQGQEMELSTSTILPITLLWINKSRKRRNSKNRLLKAKVHLHQLSSATVISAVSVLHRLQANTTHSPSQIHSWEDNL